MRTAIVGGRVVTGSGDFYSDVLIEGEKIAAVGSVDKGAVDDVIDATDRLVMPGGVDPHTHFSTPLKGTRTVDDFESGTIAAAVGGTTTIIDFPLQAPGEDPRVSHEEWRRAGESAVIDWGLHQIITDLSDEFVPAVDALVAEGVTSLKLFLAYPGNRMVDDRTLFRAMREAARTGAMVLLHCENGLVIDELERELLRTTESTPYCNALTRPPLTEAEATARGLAVAELANAPVYIVHMSAVEAVEHVRRARERGLPAYGETCPQYLLLTEDKLKGDDFDGAKYVMCPPLRSEANRQGLWNALIAKDLQVVSTDHTAFRFGDQKQRGRDDFRQIPNGVPGIEWRNTLLYDFGVHQGKMSPMRFVQLVATNPAKLFGMYPIKGEIQPGSDADLMIFDPDRRVTYTAAQQWTRSDYNPYEGWQTRGAPEKVLLRGKVIVDDGEFVGRAGQGRFIRRAPQHVACD